MPKAIDIHKMYLHTKRMLDAAKVVSRRIRGVPCVVLFGFVSELFLKILIYHQSGQLARGHDLEKLYDKLAPQTQAAVRDQFAAEYSKAKRYRRWIESESPGIRHDLESILRTNARVFEIARYVYEVDEIQVIGLDLLAGSLHEVTRTALYPRKTVATTAE